MHSQVRFNRVPEKVPEKAGRLWRRARSGSTGFRIRFNRRRFQEALVQTGFRRKFPENLWEALEESQVRFNRRRFAELCAKQAGICAGGCRSGFVYKTSFKRKTKYYTGKGPQTVWRVGNQCMRNKPQYRNCSSRSLFWHKKQRYVYSPRPFPGRLKTCHKSVKEGSSRGAKKIMFSVPRELTQHSRMYLSAGTVPEYASLS